MPPLWPKLFSVVGNDGKLYAVLALWRMIQETMQRRILRRFK
jgi:hypothetical protein